MNKHNKKYHDDNSLAAIPTSLRKASARPQQDRPRFLLKEPSSNSRKSPSHILEEAKAIGEYTRATHDAQYIQKPQLSTGGNENKGTISCICLSEENDERLIECDGCHTMQHILCYYIDEYGNALSVKEHLCVLCKPRPLDAGPANIRQMERKRQRLEYLQAVESTKKLQLAVSPTYWSLQERHIFRTFLRQHGPDWEKIAKDMRSRTAHGVYRSFYNIGYAADLCRAR